MIQTTHSKSEKVGRKKEKERKIETSLGFILLYSIYLRYGSERVSKY